VPCDVSAEQQLAASHPRLLPTLRPHQVRAVLWAVNVERNGVSGLQEWWERAAADIMIPVVPGVVFNPFSGQIHRLPIPKLPKLDPLFGG
jgi:hypothetical protein